MAIPKPSSVAGDRAWGSIGLGPYTIPVNMDLGSVVVQAKAKAKQDQKGSGQKKPTTTKQGAELAEFQIDMEFHEDLLPEVEEAILGLPVGSGPWPVNHPTTTLARVSQVTIVGVDYPVPKAFQSLSMSWSIREWVPPPPPAAKPATTTPKDPGAETVWNVASGNAVETAQKGVASASEDLIRRVRESMKNP